MSPAGVCRDKTQATVILVDIIHIVTTVLDAVISTIGTTTITTIIIISTTTVIISIKISGSTVISAIHCKNLVVGHTAHRVPTAYHIRRHPTLSRAGGGRFK